MAHAGDLGRKLEAIQNVESRVVAPILRELTERGEDFRLLLLSDHPHVAHHPHARRQPRPLCHLR